MNITKSNITPALKTIVNAVLIAKASAKLMRSEVDKIQRAVLQECPLNLADEWKARGRADRPLKITEPKDTYLSNDAEFADYSAECSKRERAAGLKPESMPEDHCPALVAEDIERQAVALLIDEAAASLGLDMSGADLRQKLFCLGLDQYNRFVDLVIGLVVNSPDFKNPLQKSA